MADNKLVLDPGWRALDANGDPLPGAKLRVYEAQTPTPRTVYADDDLSNSLPIPIVCDSGGYPTSDGNAKSLVYTGLNPFKIELYTATDVLVWSHDNIPGALDTSPFGGDTRITSPSLTVSTDQVLGFDDSGILYNVNCSGGDVTITLGPATVLEDGWRVGIRHNGSTNQVKILTTGGELIALPNVISTTAFALGRRGEEIWIRCDGAGFTAGEHTPGLIRTVGVITIVTRTSSPPGSPPDGARYIISSSPSGDWSSYATGDVMEANGQGGWILLFDASDSVNTDCGWIAYVQDEDTPYIFMGTAWVSRAIATKASMETATSLVDIVTPGRVRYNPGVAKGWCVVGVSGNIITSHNVSSVVDNGAGDVSVLWDTDFTSANYAITANVRSGTGTVRFAQVDTRQAGECRVYSLNVAASRSDPDNDYSIVSWGAQ